MSVTARDLLTDVEATLRSMPTDTAMTAQAAGVIDHCGRLFRTIQFDDFGGYRTEERLIEHLADACASVARTWVRETGRAEALAGAAVDVLTRETPTMTNEGQWATVVAAATMTRRCSDRAGDFGNYRSLAQLADVRAAAAAIEQRAARFPPTPIGNAVLDRVIAATSTADTTDPATAALDCITALTTTVESHTRHHVLRMAELLAAAAAAERLTKLAIDAAKAITVDTGPVSTPAYYADRAWNAVTKSCAPFDDGTKSRPPGDSAIIRWTVALDHDLDRLIALSRAHLDPSRDDLATAARGVANRLPELAEHLQRGVRRWAQGAFLLARERNLPSYETRNLHADVATDRIVIARGSDVEPIDLALSDAHRLGIGLAAELHRTSEHIGDQPHPGLAAAYGQSQRHTTTAGVLQVRAERARLAAAATGGAEQWAYARRMTGPRHGR